MLIARNELCEAATRVSHASYLSKLLIRTGVDSLPASGLNDFTALRFSLQDAPPEPLLAYALPLFVCQTWEFEVRNTLSYEDWQQWQVCTGWQSRVSGR